MIPSKDIWTFLAHELVRNAGARLLLQRLGLLLLGPILPILSLVFAFALIDRWSSAVLDSGVYLGICELMSLSLPFLRQIHRSSLQIDLSSVELSHLAKFKRASLELGHGPPSCAEEGTRTLVWVASFPGVPRGENERTMLGTRRRRYIADGNDLHTREKEALKSDKGDLALERLV